MTAAKIEMLTLPEVAELLSVDRRTIERVIAAGKLKKTKIGRCTRILRTELDRYIRANTGCAQ